MAVDGLNRRSGSTTLPKSVEAKPRETVKVSSSSAAKVVPNQGDAYTGNVNATRGTGAVLQAGGLGPQSEGAQAAATLLDPNAYLSDEARGYALLEIAREHQNDPQFMADFYKTLGPTHTSRLLGQASAAAASNEDFTALGQSLSSAFSTGQFSVGEQRMFGEQAARNLEDALAISRILSAVSSSPGANEMRRGFLDTALTSSKALGTGSEAGMWARAAGEAMAGDASGAVIGQYLNRMSEADRTRFFENGINQGPSWGPRTSVYPFNGLEEVMRQASAQGLLPARIEALRVPNDAELIERLNGVRTTPLTPEQEQLIRNMSDPQERRMFLATVRQLEGVQAGTVTPSQYMVNVMQSAADIAGNDGGKFAHLVHLAFNEPSSSYSLNLERGVTGGGHIPVGALLEDTFKELDGDRNNVAGGYNPNIIDVDSVSTVTHHFAEFLAVGNSLQGGLLGNWAATVIDDPNTNPGDVRSSYFGVMVGQALRNGQISPQQAVDLVAWAYTGTPASMDPPPWDNAGSTGYLDPNTDYNIQNWLRMYEEAR